MAELLPVPTHPLRLIQMPTGSKRRIRLICLRAGPEEALEVARVSRQAVDGLSKELLFMDLITECYDGDLPSGEGEIHDEYD